MSTPETPEGNAIWAAVVALHVISNPLNRMSAMLLTFEAMGWNVIPHISADKRTVTWRISVELQ